MFLDPVDPVGEHVARDDATTQLPLDDPSVDELTPEHRQLLSSNWERRVKSEREVGLAFEALQHEARRLAADPAVIQLLELAARQEQQHAEICRRLAERYGARTVGEPDLSDFRLGSFGESDPRLEFTLHLVGLCCVNETLATAWIRSCLDVARTPLSRAANRAHLREEIDHARIGWAHLASCRDDQRLLSALQPRLGQVITVNVRQWLQPDLYVDVEELQAHGVPGLVRSRQAILSALYDLVLPGFAHLGIEVPTLEGVATELTTGGDRPRA